jgi:hypothetical protein
VQRFIDHPVCPIGVTSVLVARFYLGTQIQEDEVGRACDVWGRREMQTAFRLGNLKERY